MKQTKCFTIANNRYLCMGALTAACEPIMQWSLLWCSTPTQIMIVRSLQDVFLWMQTMIWNFLQWAYNNLAIYVLITNGIIASFKEKPP